MASWERRVGRVGKRRVGKGVFGKMNGYLGKTDGVLGKANDDLGKVTGVS